MFALLRRFRTAWHARAVKFFITRQTVRAFRVMHADELSKAPLQSWPVIRARHNAEIRAIKAGKITGIVDRKSWSFPYLPSTVQRLSMPVAKTTPYNLRRFSRTPVARRAINLIKNSVTSQTWDIVPDEDVLVEHGDQLDQKARIRIAKKAFKHPNNTESFQSWLEMNIEDMCILGAGCSEMKLTLDPERPVKLWAVDVSTIRIFASWSESTPEMPRYAQMTGLQGERGAILFYNDELMYVKDNPATDNPFGLGKLEVAFQQLNDLLGVQRMAGMAGADQVHKTWLWWEQPQSDAAYQIVRRHIQNNLEGQAKVSIIGGMKKPEVLELTPVTEQDLLLNWQEMLIRMVANAFDMSAMALGVEHDVNRAVGDVLKDADFRSAVVPMARRLEEAFTRKVLHETLGWYDLRFRFLQLDDPDLETKTDMNARMYSANALTPNEWRASVGKPALKSPYGDLTQFDAMLVNQQMMVMVQNQQAEQAAQRQQQMQEKMAQSQPPESGPGGPPFAGKPGAASPGGAPMVHPPSQGQIARGGQVESPRPLALPKFPISGSRWTAKQVARMPVNELADRIDGGELPQPKKLVRDMADQEPNILDQLSDEVKAYLAHVIKESDDDDDEIPDEFLRDYLQRLRKKVSEKAKRSDDMTDYLQQVNQKWKLATPASPNAKTYRAVKNPGKPGTPPPARSL